MTSIIRDIRNIRMSIFKVSKSTLSIILFCFLAVVLFADWDSINLKYSDKVRNIEMHIERAPPQ